MDKFSKRLGVTIVALAFAIATINAATLYVQATAKTATSDLQKEVERLKRDMDAQKRKNAAVDAFLKKALGTLERE